MQGVQGFLTNGRTKVAAYEEYSILGRCPECRADLVNAGEEGGELACSNCGVVVGTAASVRDDGSSAPSVSKNGPLGSYFLTPGDAGPSRSGPAFGLARLNPNIIGRGGPLQACTEMTDRIASNLELPKSVAQSANLIARRLLPCRKDIGATIPAISAYSLLHACRSAGISHISHKTIVEAYNVAGFRVCRSKLLRIGLDSPVPLPHASVEELVKAAVGKLQSSEAVAARLRERNLDPREYFTRLLELAKEVASQASGLNGFNPRTIAAGSVYLASVAIAEKKTFTQHDAGETLGMAEYTVREFCCRSRNEMGLKVEAQVGLVKSGSDLRRA
ncbi:MAG: hypothetical protein OK454_01945 [Thaumarchaeota archaeon]|nr:hypothetical protein [Nitrososphaerota archaeon]